ncbi:MAG: hypothetical protein R3C13_11955 [Hyphomonas sp.]|uniref:hypothetical protein n=1 Tax=Hyphomonas sp. TaxID=87 RepID=UPI0035294C55
MEFKRWRLSATSPVVNAGLGLALLFTAAGCSKQEKAAEIAPEAAEIAADVELPAVWATRSLAGPVRSLALSGGTGGVLAVAYKDGGLQLFNMDAERLGEPIQFRIRALANGKAATIAGRTLTLFPGVTDDGAMKAYVYGEGLMAPAQVDLPVDGESHIAGICSGPTGTEGLMRLAFWTETNNRVLQAGIVRESEGELSWDRGDSTFTDFPIRSCAYTEDTLVASPRAVAAAPLVRGGFSGLLSLEEDSALNLSTDLGMTSSALKVRDGITVVMPDSVDAMTAMGTMMSGGYPGGLIVVAGEVAPDDNQVVFIDPSVITLAGTN